MTTTINASTSSGLVNTADTSGIIKLQSNGVTTNALAWVNFNGTGTVAIRSSYNVSSITDNGTGDYTLNFTTALSDANYAAIATSSQNVATGYNWSIGVSQATSPTTSALRLLAINGVGTSVDASYVNVAIFGN